VVPTLKAFDNGNTRATVLIVENNRRDGARLYEDVMPTLQGFMGTGGGNVPMVAYPIQDGREIEKSQNGLGIGNKNDPSFTLDRTGAQAVAIQGNMINRADTAGPQGKGYTEEGEPMFTLTKTDIHAVASSSIVRRLTPTECERLQGFPDGWTEDQADTHRYKQMGNAVAVPVVSWLVQRLMEVNK
jgi:site-specific DNA-cytosine methylase